MHYQNGREAKNGDKVVHIPPYGTINPETGKVFPNAAVGILYDAVPGNDYCNGKIAPMSPNDPMPNLQDCLHLDDVLAAVKAAQDKPEASNGPRKSNAKPLSPFAEDAGVVIHLPSGHKETVSTDEAESLYYSLQELGL